MFTHLLFLIVLWQFLRNSLNGTLSEHRRWFSGLNLKYFMVGDSNCIDNSTRRYLKLIEKSRMHQNQDIFILAVMKRRTTMLKIIAKWLLNFADLHMNNWWTLCSVDKSFVKIPQQSKIKKKHRKPLDSALNLSLGVKLFDTCVSRLPYDYYGASLLSMNSCARNSSELI